MTLYMLQAFRNEKKQYELITSNFDEILSETEEYLLAGYRVYLEQQELKIIEPKGE